MKPIRVAIICQHLTMGGAEELVLGIATNLPAERYEVRVFCLTAEGEIALELRQAGVDVTLVPGEPGPRDPAALLRLMGALRRFGPDIAHTFLLNACLYGRLAAIVSGVPVILAAEQNVYANKARKHVLMERWLARRTHRVIACCDIVGSFYRRQVGVGLEKVTVLCNAVRYDQILPLEPPARSRVALGLDPEAPTIGVIGRLTRQKGQDVLFQAVRQLRPAFPNLQVALAGQGEARSELEQLAADLGIQQQVHFLGVRRDRSVFYGALDAFVLPSRWEGLSLALAEAVGAGVPSIATDVGGNAEVILDGRTGLLVPAEQPEALAAAIESVLRNPPLAERLSTAGQQDAQTRFGIRQHVAALDRLYVDAVTQRTGRLLARHR